MAYQRFPYRKSPPLHIQLDALAMHGGARLQDLATGQIIVKYRVVGQEADPALDRDPILEGVEIIDPDDALAGLRSIYAGIRASVFRDSR
jgi:hypothetical protein